MLFGRGEKEEAREGDEDKGWEMGFLSMSMSIFVYGDGRTGRWEGYKVINLTFGGLRKRGLCVCVSVCVCEYIEL